MIACILVVDSVLVMLIRNAFSDLTVAAKKHEEGSPEEEPTKDAKEPVNQQIHRMFLLRVKLMHFVNTLHNFIMTRVRPVFNVKHCMVVCICFPPVLKDMHVSGCIALLST